MEKMFFSSRNFSAGIIIATFCIFLIGSTSGCVSARMQATPAYGVKIGYVRGKPLRFPDLILEFTGEREEKSPSYPRSFKYFDFIAQQGDQKITISWSSGTGDIAPISFALGQDHYRLELVSSDTLGRLEKDELVLWKDAGK